MCGIAGEIAFGGDRADIEAVARMTTVLAARGPDGEGTWSDGRVALGHRRLSIIDRSEAGAQPMIDDERDLVVVFNGCIYNHESLRHELELGYRFRSRSDTEVVLAAYARWGLRFPEHLVGMFVIALVDRRSERVVLVRDRLGVKPLYLSRSPERVRFASTLPALLAGGEVDTDLDPVALHHYLSWHAIVPAPRTLLRGVEKLPAATIRVIEGDGTAHDREYWRPEYVRDPDKVDWDERDWLDALHDALRRAVRRRLVADVPVGVLLSGGLDSSLLVALLAEEGHERVPTFSIGFGDAGGERGDEFEYSDAVARLFGTDHHRIRIPDDELRAAIPDAIDAMTEPMATPDVTAFYLLAARVREEVRVVQCGQGADEVFAGYQYHQPAALAPREDAAAAFSGAFVDRSHEDVRAMLAPDRRAVEDESATLIQADLDRPGAETALDAVLRLDTHRLMIDDPVKRLDSMSMAWGLEARVPFLDQDLVELAAQCPPALKAAQGGKGVLKNLARRLLPGEVIDRPKGYFPVPAMRHLDRELCARLEEALRAPEAQERGLFEPTVVERLLDRPNALHTRVGGNVLWQVGLLELWLQHRDIT